MKQLRVIERLSGTGTLSGADIIAGSVVYEITVKQWIHRIETFGGTSESPGLYNIQAYLSVPSSAQSSILKLLADDGHAELLLSDGRKAAVLITGAGDRIGNTIHLHCPVDSLDGYT